MAPAAPDVAALFDAHGADLLRYLRRRVGPDVAEDVLHETFLALLRRPGAADPDRGGERAWLFGTATHLVSHHHRGAVRAVAATERLGGITETVTDPLAGVADRVDAAARVRQLAGALAELDPDDRDVLLLVAWAGLTPTEAAGALGIPPGTARSRLHRVRRTLRAAAPARTDLPGGVR